MSATHLLAQAVAQYVRYGTMLSDVEPHERHCSFRLKEQRRAYVHRRVVMSEQWGALGGGCARQASPQGVPECRGSQAVFPLCVPGCSALLAFP